MKSYVLCALFGTTGCEPVSYTHLDVYKRQRMYHLPSEEPINIPCTLLLEFPLAFTNVIPHQLDDDTLGPIIEKIKSGEEMCIRDRVLTVWFIAGLV